jgi:hypothetical protein
MCAAALGVRNENHDVIEAASDLRPSYKSSNGKDATRYEETDDGHPRVVSLQHRFHGHIVGAGGKDIINDPNPPRRGGRDGLVDFGIPLAVH